MLVAEYNGGIIGNISINRKPFRWSHVAVLGIIIKKGYRSMGLGSILIKTMIEIAKKDPKIKILCLDVYSENNKAIKLYERLGFKKVSRLPKRILYRGRYIDSIAMDYPLNKI
jgi:ribosomal protein S18 acetylase RimI-like enzyme